MRDAIDDEIRASLDELGRSAHPPETAVAEILTHANGRRRRRRVGRVVGALGAACLIAAVTAGVVGAWPPPTDTKTPPASGSDLLPAADLTGTQVGDALGLSPVTYDDCKGDVFAEYPGHPKDTGYCLNWTSLGIASPDDQRLLGWQIAGYPRTPELTEYFQLFDEKKSMVEDIESHPENIGRLQEITARMAELSATIGMDVGHPLQ